MIKLKNLSILCLFCVVFTACNFLEETDDRDVIARVNDSYLYNDDVAFLISENTTSEDSALIVSSYINRWATQRLLIDRAKVNLSEQKQREFEKLVKNYQNELYANAYTDVIIGRQLDTSISMEVARTYYEENGENFILNENLLKLRYINLTKDNKDFDKIKTLFRRFEEEDKQELLDMAIQFNSYSLNDSVWVKSKQVYDKIKPLTPENDSELLKKQNFLQLEDSLGVYLISVEDIKLRNEQAPLEYTLPNIKQILLNKRKLELKKELEKDITQDAIKNDKFEIYN
ncbi:peptidyl-prolyl cis-trans isomerase [Salinimicrobium gaetbulicola]|uniref:Peptidyl-prolyl cis-trans isomerase n=1 Tax=Salinimicrobium gaetbulicola TaxID=999702 RepID=A0ABW3IIR0_9FLAO